VDIASILGLEAIIRLLPEWIASHKRHSFFVWWAARRLEATARKRDDWALPTSSANQGR